MKFEEEVQCINCGKTFIRTNPTNEYCKGACRVEAHRKRQGDKKPILDREQVALVEEVLEIYPHKFNELVEDAIKFRILKKMEERAILNGEIEEYYYYNRITSQIENQEFDFTPLSFDAEFSTNFTRPIKKLLEYSKRNSINLFKKGNL